MTVSKETPVDDRVIVAVIEKLEAQKGHRMHLVARKERECYVVF